MPNAGMVVLPQFQGNYYDLQRQQALAQALTQQALQGSQPAPAAAVGPYQVQPKYSIGAGIAQLGQALLASRMADRVSQGYNQLGAQQAQAFGFGAPAAQADGSSNAALAQGASQGDVGPTLTNAARMDALQAAAPAQGGSATSPMNPLGLPPALAYTAYASDPAKYAEMQAAAYKPTDMALMLRQAGIDPSSPLGRSVMQQAIVKANNIPLVAGRAGAPMYDYEGHVVAMAPKIPDNAIPTIQNGQVTGVTGLPGATDIEAANATAKASGPASFNLQKVWNRQTKQYEFQPATNVSAAAGGTNLPLPLRNNNPGAVSPGGKVASYPDMQTGLAAMDQNLANYAKDPNVKTLADAITKWVGSPPNAPAYIKDVSTRLGIGANTPVDLTNPAQRQAIGTAIMLHESGPSAVFGGGGAAGAGSPQATSPQPRDGAMAAEPQAGFTKGQEDLQGDLTKKWGALNDANSQAQTTISYLQNIRDLASKAATGQQSDKLNFVNGLLSLAGSERATNMVTANNLLDKYSNQIVARLGTGSLGTDAARSILASAYPNAHMTNDAINEAVSNLVGASQMTQAKARLLQGAYNARDPQAYNQKEMVFDQNADPRIWQYKNITDPNARKAFARQVLQQDPQFPAKIKALEGIGAL